MARMTDAGTLHAITVLGHDRPGIIAWTTDRLASLGLNIEDTSMTLLRGHFAMTLVCAGAATDDEISAALAPLTEDGSLTVTVREVPHEEPHAPADSQWVLTVHGGDRGHGAALDLPRGEAARSLQRSCVAGGGLGPQAGKHVRSQAFMPMPLPWLA